MNSRFPITFATAILCTATYLTSAILAYSLYLYPYSPLKNWLSDLGNQIDNPQGANFYNVGVILTAAFLAAWFTVGLTQLRIKDNPVQNRLLAIAQVAGVLAAFALIMSALYPINHQAVHSFWSKVHFMMFGMCFGFSVAALRYHPRIPKASLYFGAGAAVLPTLMLIFGKAFWLEWVAVGCMIVFLLSTGVASLSSPTFIELER